MNNMNRRCGYILTLNPNSERALFSKNILEKIGFDVFIGWLNFQLFICSG